MNFKICMKCPKKILWHHCVYHCDGRNALHGLIVEKKTGLKTNCIVNLKESVSEKKGCTLIDLGWLMKNSHLFVYNDNFNKDSCPLFDDHIASKKQKNNSCT